MLNMRTGLGSALSSLAKWKIFMGETMSCYSAVPGVCLLMILPLILRMTQEKVFPIPLTAPKPSKRWCQ